MEPKPTISARPSPFTSASCRGYLSKLFHPWAGLKLVRAVKAAPKVTVTGSPTRISLPAPPLRISLPAPPFKMSLLRVPYRTLGASTLREQALSFQ